jgi:hypothetical protein
MLSPSRMLAEVTGSPGRRTYGIAMHGCTVTCMNMDPGQQAHPGWRGAWLVIVQPPRQASSPVGPGCAACSPAGLQPGPGRPILRSRGLGSGGTSSPGTDRPRLVPSLQPFFHDALRLVALCSCLSGEPSRATVAAPPLPTLTGRRWRKPSSLPTLKFSKIHRCKRWFRPARKGKIKGRTRSLTDIT